MWHTHPGRKGNMKTNTREWSKEKEKVGWGEGREVVVAKNRFMKQLEPLQGRPVGFQYDIGGGNRGNASSGLGGTVVGICWRL